MVILLIIRHQFLTVSRLMANSQRRKMSDVTCSSVSSGMGTEEIYVKWKICNFKYLLESWTLLTTQKFQVKTGVSLGCPTDWEFFLTTTQDKPGEDSWIGLRYAMKTFHPGKIAQSKLMIILLGRSEVDHDYFTDTDPTVWDSTMKGHCFGWPKVLLYNKAKKTLLIDGALVIEAHFTVHLEKKPGLERFLIFPATKAKSFDRMISDLEQVFDHHDGNGGKIAPLLQNKQILIARNPELAVSILTRQSTFKSGLLRTLLGFLYFGGIPVNSFPSWKSITDVAIVAKEYNIPELLAYCDAILADKCTMVNASEVLRIARELELVKSVKEIQDYIENNAGGFFEPTPEALLNDDEPPDYYADDIYYQNYSKENIVTTGLKMEEGFFTWCIDGFNVIWSKLELTTQSFTYSSDSNTKWSLTLTKSREGVDDWLGMTCQLLNCPDDKQVLVQFRINFTFPKSGCESFKWESLVENISVLRKGIYPKIMKLTALQEEQPSRKTLMLDGFLHVITLIEPAILDSCNHTRYNFKKQSTLQLSSDLENLYKYGGDFDVKLVSKSDKEFRAHKSVLRARSTTCNGLFKPDVDQEPPFVVNLKDASDKGVSILLHYFYTGKIGEANCAEDIGELAMLAEKFALEELRNQCEELLAARCDSSNARISLDAARKSGLSKAEAFILHFIRETVKHRAAHENEDLSELYDCLAKRMCF